MTPTMRALSAGVALGLALSLVAACSSSNNGGSSAGDASGAGGSAGTGGVDGGAGTGGGAGVGGDAAATTPLGRACSTSQDCAAGLTCLGADSTELGGAGPAKGLCTADCTADLGKSSSSICTAIDPAAVCVDLGAPGSPHGVCLEGCSAGPDSLTDFDPGKCHGRHELACEPVYDSNNVSTGKGYCRPNCNSDADCGGRTCNPRTGLCDDQAAQGLPVGSSCPAPGSDAGADPCRGTCGGVVHSFGGAPFTYTCSERCTIGAVPSCGWDGSGPADAYCVFVYDANAGRGDQGACGQTCDCNSDCLDPDLVCLPFNNATLESQLGHKGYCGDPLGLDGGTNPGISCSDAGL